MVVAPKLTAVTSPVKSIVATAGFNEVHGEMESGIPEPVNCVVPVPGKQMLKFPVMLIGFSDLTEFKFKS